MISHNNLYNWERISIIAVYHTDLSRTKNHARMRARFGSKGLKIVNWADMVVDSIVEH